MHEFESPCTDFCTDAQGGWLAACSEGGHEKKGRVCLWKATGLSPADHVLSRDVYAKCEPELVTHEFVWRVALVSDADGRLVVATAGSPREISLWDAETGEPLARMTGHRDVVRCCGALGEAPACYGFRRHDGSHLGRYRAGGVVHPLSVRHSHSGHRSTRQHDRHYQWHHHDPFWTRPTFMM